MLVLSRRESDRVVFPNLGITVHVTRIEGRTVRLGSRCRLLVGLDDRVGAVGRELLQKLHVAAGPLDREAIDQRVVP